MTTITRHTYTMAGRFARALLMGETDDLSTTDLVALEAFREAAPPCYVWKMEDGMQGWWYDHCQITGRMDDCVTLSAIQLS